MKLLFIFSQVNLTRHFDSVLLALAERGHDIHIASPRIEDIPLEGALARHRRISHGECPDGRTDRWRDAVKTLRAIADYVRYLDPAFAPAWKLRDRAFRTMAKALTADAQTHLKARCPSCKKRIRDDDLGQLLKGLGESGVAGFAQLLAQIEARVPSDAAYEGFLREQAPDAVLVTPMVNLKQSQADWVKAARALNVPAGFPVFSWDNLTTKGVMHELPDRVLVWNEVQKQEAIRYHGVSDDRIDVTGASRFDAFFAMKPREKREVFLRDFKLDPARPLVTYLCSSDFVAGGESAFVKQWIQEVRQESRLAEANVLIRPHPRLVDEWTDAATAREFASFGNVAIAPSRAMNADQLLYDTLFHSASVVGINTSAQIEAGILGRPVCTLIAPGFAGGQAGTLHFHYLLRAHGGFVDLAESFEQHRAMLVDALEGRYDAKAIQTFIEMFVRPRGLDQSVTPILADAIERLPAERRRASGPGVTNVPPLDDRPGRVRDYVRSLRGLPAPEHSPALAGAEARCPVCSAAIRGDAFGRMLLALGDQGLDALDQLFTLASDEQR